MTKRESGSCSEGFAPRPGDRADTCPESIERRPAGRPQRDGALGPVAFREEAGGGGQAAAMTGVQSARAAKRGNTAGGQDVPNGAVRAGATRGSGGAEVPCASCRPVVGRAVWDGRRRIGMTCCTVGGWPETGRPSPSASPGFRARQGVGRSFFTALTGAIRKPPVCRACGPLRPRDAREMPARRTAGDGARRAPSRGRRSAPVRCSTAGREAPRQRRKPSPWLRPATPWRSPLYTRRAYARGTRRRALAGTSSRRRNANGVPSARRPSRQESSGRLRGHDHP